MIIDMKRIFETITGLLALLISPALFAQSSPDSLYQDLDIYTQKPVRSVSFANADSNKRYIKYFYNKKGKQTGIGIYETTKYPHQRTGNFINTRFGNVLAFNMLKTPGFEKVIIFGQKYYYEDSVLFRNDTVYYKEDMDEYVKLSVVYPSRGDTLIVKEIYKDYHWPPVPSKARSWAALKNYKDWFADYNDETTFKLLKKETYYDIIEIATTEKPSEYDINRYKKIFREAGLSAFWIAVRRIVLD